MPLERFQGAVGGTSTGQGRGVCHRGRLSWTALLLMVLIFAVLFGKLNSIYISLCSTVFPSRQLTFFFYLYKAGPFIEIPTAR
jgi:hypothetical protein